MKYISVAIVCTFLINISCSHKRNRVVANNPDLSSLEFVDGLLSSPNDSKRKLAGQEMFDFFVEFFNNKKSESPFLVSNRLTEVGMTRRIFLYSAMFLKDGLTCKEEEKVRLYRGTRNMFIRPKELDEKNGVYLANAFLKSFKRHDGDIGLAQYEELKEFDSPFNLDWEQMLGWGKIGMLGNVDGDFSELLRTHNSSSSESVFISATVYPEIAEEFSSESVVVLDMCPERISFVKFATHHNFREGEILIPFFILPEEITAIIPKDKVKVEINNYRPSNSISKKFLKIYQQPMPHNIEETDQKFFNELKDIKYSTPISWREHLIRTFN